MQRTKARSCSTNLRPQNISANQIGNSSVISKLLSFPHVWTLYASQDSLVDNNLLKVEVKRYFKSVSSNQPKLESLTICSEAYCKCSTSTDQKIIWAKHRGWSFYNYALGWPEQIFSNHAETIRTFLPWAMDDENEDILVQIQEEQRQFAQRFARRLHQVGKREPFPYLMKPPGETLCKLSLFFLYLY